jgi:MFS family permease
LPLNDNSENSPQKTAGFYYGYVIIIACFFITLVVYIVQYAFGVFFKPMSSEFGWNRALTSGAFSLSWIVQGVLGIVMGGLNDRFGPRLVISICGFLIGISYLLMSQISAVWQFYILSGVLVGAGLSGIVIPLGSTMARWFVNKRNMMTGLGFLGVSSGVLVGSPISVLLISEYNWRTSYLILGGVVIVIVLIAAQWLKREPPSIQHNSEKRAELSQRAGNEVRSLSLKEATSIKQFWLVATALFCLGFVNFAVFVHIVPHATDLGIEPGAAAGIMAIIGVGACLGGLLLSIIADKIGNKNVYIVGYSIMLLTLFSLLFAQTMLPFYIFAIFFGFALGGCNSTQSPFIASLFGLRAHGLIFGVLICGYSIGSTLGSLIPGYIFDSTGNYQWSFIIDIILGLIAITSIIVLKPVKWVK